MTEECYMSLLSVVKILDGSIPEKEIYRMIEESYDLVRGKKSTRRT